MITDDDLRDELAGADPAGRHVAPDVLDRVPTEDARPAAGRRWTTALLSAAAVVAVALLGFAVLPRILPDAGSNDSGASQSSQAAMADIAVSSPDSATEPAPDSLTMARTASLLVGAEDPAAAADAYVRTIETLGGRVNSQTVVTAGSASGPVMPVGTEPWPWYPNAPGVWLTVQVPADAYDQAVAAAQSAGEVVRLEQSSYDVGAQIADTDARIKALESSLDRLRALMDDADSVTEIISLEDAITTRQAELDGLRAQQRQLSDQTQMSQISLTLMTPGDAKAAVDPSPGRDWIPVIAWVAVASAAALLAVLAYRRFRRR